MILFYLNMVNIPKRLPAIRWLFRRWCRVAGPILFFLVFSGCSIHPTTVETSGHEYSPSSDIIWLYQGPLNHLSAVRYGECPMYPGCSKYALEAIKHHGALIGWIMAFDRLIRCGMDETHLSPEVWVNGHWKYIDTPAQNDFWWYSNADDSTARNSKSTQDLDWGIAVE